jgi:hypothetical protein
VAEVLTVIQEQYPRLRGLLGDEGRVAAEYLLSINGERFVTEVEERLSPGEHLLILSADAGG